MSNDLMIPELSQLPAHLRDVTPDPMADSLITTGPSITRLSIKGSKFRIRRGEEETLLKLLEMSVVIVAAMPLGNVPAKTFYDVKYVEGEDSPPACMSSDGIRPDTGVANPQSTSTCAVCPKNQWGSRITDEGKDAKACSDTKVLYILAPKQDGTLSDEVVQLRVPATSLRALSKYAAALKGRKIPVNAVLTKLSFADTAHPQLDFTFGGFLTEDQFAQVKEVAAGDVIAQVLKGEVPIAEPEHIQAKDHEEPAQVVEVKPQAKVETQSSIFDDDDIEEDDEEIEEEDEEVDADGRPWDERIDSSNHKMGKNGKWMKRRGVDMDEYKRIRKEILSSMDGRSTEAPKSSTSTPTSQATTAVDRTPTSPKEEPIGDDELDALLAGLE